MTTTLESPNDKVKRLVFDVYEDSLVYKLMVVDPDKNPVAEQVPVYRGRQVAATAQCANGAFFGYTIFCDEGENLFDVAETEREKAAVRFGLKTSDVEVEYHDMHIPRFAGIFRFARRFARNIAEKYVELVRS